MRVIWRSTLFLAALTLAAGCGANAFAQQHGVHLVVRQTATQSLTLIKPTDPNFESTLDADFPGVSGTVNYQKIRPYLLMLQNDTPLPAMAYSVRWQLQYAGGVSGGFFSRQFVARPLMDRSFVPSIPPGAVRLISPLFNLSPEDYQRRYASDLDFFAQQFGPSRFPHSPKLTSVDVSVDGVVYRDGSFIGPNKTQVLQRYVAAQFAARDEALEVLNEPPMLGVQRFQILNQEKQRNLKADRNTLLGFYVHARGQSAEDLQRILRNRGVSGLHALLQNFVNRQGGRQASSMFDRRYRSLSDSDPRVFESAPGALR